MKYLVIEDQAGMENIHLFSSSLNHNQMAECLGGIPVAAGHIVYEGYKDEPTTLYCAGESVTLKLKSRHDEDTALLRATLNAF